MKITEFKKGDRVSFLSHYTFTDDSLGRPGEVYVSADRKRTTGVVTATGIGFRKNGIQVTVDETGKVRDLYQPDGVKLVG